MVRMVSVTLALFMFLATTSCQQSEQLSEAEVAMQSFLDDTGGPPEPLPTDELMKGKADAIVLPTISVSVWLVGALIVYIGTQEVFHNTIEDFETVLQAAFGWGANWDWAEGIDEPSEQALHLSEALNRIAYRSETSDFYSLNGNDYLRLLNMTSPISILNPDKLKDLVDGKVRPWGQYAKEYFAALQVASMHARHLANGKESQGLCARATITSKSEPFENYYGRARATCAADIIPAIVFASVKATIRCGMWDSEIREYVHGYYSVGGPMDALPDIFMSHILKSAKLIYMYVDSCQMPPKILVDLDSDDCHDVTIE